MTEEAKALIRFAVEDYNKSSGKHAAIDTKAFNDVLPLIDTLWKAADINDNEGCIVEIDPDTLDTVFKMNLYALDVVMSENNMSEVLSKCNHLTIIHAGEFMFFSFSFKSIIK